MPPPSLHRPLDSMADPRTAPGAQASDRARAPDCTQAPDCGDAASPGSIHSRVLSVVASRIRGSDARDGDAADCVQLLCDALVESDDAFDRALARARSQHGLGDEEIVDCYIPAIACRLGSDWSDNRRSFAEVTIGTARLIATVRHIGRRWTADSVADWRAPAMVMVVPETEQHRLGAMIAATRFRRLGVSVQMLLGRPDDEVLARLRDGGFDIVSFSLATRERVEQTRRLIQKLREGVPALPPVLVGGAVGIDAEDLKSQLGADHVVSDPEEALRRCGVSIPKPRRGTAAPLATA